jgi:membrane protein
MPRRRPALLKRILQRATSIWAVAWGQHTEAAHESKPPPTTGEIDRKTLPASESSTDRIPGRARALLRLLKATAQEYERDYARYFAVAMIYYALVSLVPLLLLLMAGFGLLLRLSPAVAAAQQTLLESVERGFGGDVGSTVERLAHVLEQQSVMSLSTSLVGLLLTASVLVRHLQLSFRAIWQYPSILISGPLLEVALRTLAQKLLAYILAVGGAAVLLLSLVLVAGMNWLMGRVGDDWALTIPSSLVIVPLMFALMYRYLPPGRLPWRHVWLAALLCGATWLTAAKALTIFSVFLGTNYGAYGAAGALLATMIGLNIVSQCLFFGAELCKVLARPGLRSSPIET